jgi:FkbM family methyltransferase
MINAPVILFTYNRPDLVKRTLASLRKNQLADQTDLYIFSDGPKVGTDLMEIAKITEVRKIIRDEQWCKSVTIIEQPINKGLATSVIEGVTDIVGRYGKVIVVEDDVLLSPYFLKFMNNALKLYEKNERILSIGSWNYFCDPSLVREDHFFFRYPDSIAWATYARAWDLFERDASVALKKLKEENKMLAFTADGNAAYFKNMLDMQIEKKVDSWAIRWTATSIINNMLNVFPKQTLSKHIGFGKESTHEKSEVDYNSNLILADYEIRVTLPAEIKESKVAMKEWQKFVKINFMTNPQDYSFRFRLRKLAKKTAYRMARAVIKTVKGYGLSEAEQLVNDASKFERYKPTEFSYRNFKFQVTDFLSVANQIKEYFEEERIKVNLPDNPLIIDCGSNVGISVAYFKSKFPGAEIIAFEADPKVFSLLQLNIANNNLEGVELHNKAVWINDAGVEFGSEGADGGSIYFAGKKTKVESIRLKDILIRNQRVDLLKIDIEGSEVDVINDCGDTLKSVNYLFVEYHSLLHTRQELGSLLNTLLNNGFRYYIHSIGHQSKQPFLQIDPYNGMDVQLDIYAINTRYQPRN